MKTNALLAFFFFLVALFSSTRAEFVRDSEGHIVHSGGIYYFMPQDFAGGAIGGASIENPDGSCSLAVVLTNKGNAILIQSMVLTANITTSSALQLSFQPLPPNNCTTHPEWLVATDAELGENAVMVGDPSEYNNPIAGLFYFQTYNSAKHHYILRVNRLPSKLMPTKTGV